MIIIIIVVIMYINNNIIVTLKYQLFHYFQCFLPLAFRGGGPGGPPLSWLVSGGLYN